jgi:hypothetical protein
MPRELELGPRELPGLLEAELGSRELPGLLEAELGPRELPAPRLWELLPGPGLWEELPAPGLWELLPGPPLDLGPWEPPAAPQEPWVLQRRRLEYWALSWGRSGRSPLDWTGSWRSEQRLELSLEPVVPVRHGEKRRVPWCCYSRLSPTRCWRARRVHCHC